MRLIDGESNASLEAPNASVILGIADSDDRARWLGAGFAEVQPAEVGLAELDARARTIAGRGVSSCPLRHDRLRLDPLLRDARVDGRRLYLHPREFMLLWRLALAEGASLSRAQLLRDVFDLGFDPGTNRLAVHVCRLRKKLAHAGLASLLVTGPGDGGYALMLDDAPAARGRYALDAPERLREHAPALEEAAT